MAKKASIPISQIRLDGNTQSRIRIDDSTVSEYAEAMEQGRKFPPAVVFFDGTDHWLADGFHRVYAASVLKKAKIACDVREGSRRDAVLYSVGANASHGLRRTNADKRRAVETLLQDPEWVKWTDRAIAERCGVSHPFVANLRREIGLALVTVTVDSSVNKIAFRSMDGRTMNTANIGKKPVSAVPASLPEVSDANGRERRERNATPERPPERLPRPLFDPWAVTEELPAASGPEVEAEVADPDPDCWDDDGPAEDRQPSSAALPALYQDVLELLTDIRDQGRAGNMTAGWPAASVEAFRVWLSQMRVQIDILQTMLADG